MNPEAPSILFSASNAKTYKDFLEDLNDESRVNGLNQKIEELEKKIDNQTQQQNQQELDFHSHLDRKKVRWVLKYLEMKLELENFKKFYQEGKKLWQEDIRNLCKIIHTLFREIKDKDDQYIVKLKDIEKELNNIFKNQEVYSSKNKDINGGVNAVKTNDTEEHEDIEEQLFVPSKEECVTPKQNALNAVARRMKLEDTSFLSSNYSNPEAMARQENIKNSLNRCLSPRPTNTHRSYRDYESHNIKSKGIEPAHGSESLVSTSRAPNHITLNQSHLSVVLKGITLKLKKFILEGNQMIANQQYEFSESIDKTLKRVQCIVKDEESNNIFNIPLLKSAMKDHPPRPETARLVHENDKRSFVSVQSYRRSNYGGSFKSESNQDDKRVHLNLSNPADHTLNNSIYAIVNNNITPKTQTHSKPNRFASNQKSDEKSINSQKLLNKIFKIGDAGQGKEKQSYIQKIFEDVQDSLSISEREAIVYTLMDAPEDQKAPGENQNDFIKIEDILDIGTNSPNMTQFNRFKQNSINRSLFDEGNNNINHNNVSNSHINSKNHEGLRSDNLNNYAMCDTIKASSLRSDDKDFNQSYLPHFKASEIEQAQTDSNIFDFSENFEASRHTNKNVNNTVFVIPATIKQNLNLTQSFRTGNSKNIEKTEVKTQVTDNKGFEKLKHLINHENISPIPAGKSETVSKRINFDTFSPIQNPKFEMIIRETASHERNHFGESQSVPRMRNLDIKTPVSRRNGATPATIDRENMITELSSLHLNQSSIEPKTETQKSIQIDTPVRKEHIARQRVCIGFCGSSKSKKSQA